MGKPSLRPRHWRFVGREGGGGQQGGDGDAVYYYSSHGQDEKDGRVTIALVARRPGRGVLSRAGAGPSTDTCTRCCTARANKYRREERHGCRGGEPPRPPPSITRLAHTHSRIGEGGGSNFHRPSGGERGTEPWEHRRVGSILGHGRRPGEAGREMSGRRNHPAGVSEMRWSVPARCRLATGKA